MMLSVHSSKTRSQNTLTIMTAIISSTYRPRTGMLFALAVWFHDIGHRGNDFTDDSVEIRASHAGISEYLLLRNPRAFGIEWLKERCFLEDCRSSREGLKDNKLLECRNRLACIGPSQNELCPIRKLGLLCRHHQSNAPLDENSLENMSKKGKSPSPYSRIRGEDMSQAASMPHSQKDLENSQEDLEAWLDPDKPLTGWYGSTIRRLDGFELGCSKDSLVSLAGLLRMLDALHLHRTRIGTPTSIESYIAYLNTRSFWCTRKLQQVEKLIQTIPPGTKAHQEKIAEYVQLRRYERILHFPYVHYWRQIAVREIAVKWLWHPGGKASLRIVYQLDDWGLNSIDGIKGEVPLANGDSYPFELKGILKEQTDNLLRTANPKKKGNHESWFESPNRGPLKDEDRQNMAIWAIHVRDDIIWSEHESQATKAKGNRDVQPRAYIRFLPDQVQFEIGTSGLLSDPLSTEKEVLLLEEADF